MTNEQPSKSALASLGGPLAVADAAARERRSREILPQLRQLVRGIPARRQRKMWQRRAVVAGGVIASCALAASVWLMRVRDTDPFEVEQGPAAQSDERHGYATAADASAILRTLRGAQVAVSPSTRLSAISSDPHHELLQLAAGSVRVRVPKLGTGATFAVQTPDAIVTVHGTVFSVTVVGAGAISQTCVAVSEGLVSVERAGKRALVGAGEQLNCQAKVVSAPAATPALPPAVAPTPSVSATPLPRDHRPASGQRPPSASAARATDASLAAQNRLLAAALQAERVGQFYDARSQLLELLGRYPDSPLRTEAERSLARVSRKLP